MRIGIEAQRIFRDHKHGMDFVALEMIKVLQEIDKENDYFIFINEGPDRCLEESENFKIFQFPGPYPVWEQVKLPKMAKELNLDVLHCTSNTAPIFCSVPLIVTIHDIIYFESHPLLSKGYTNYQKFGNLYRRFVVRRLLKSASKIITVSHFERKRFIEKLGLAESDIDVVYNGVGEHFRKSYSADEHAAVTKLYNLPDKYILFLGNTDPKKNTENTVLAFADFIKSSKADVKLLIGDLDPAYILDILKKKNHEDVFERIQFTGYIQNTDLPAILNQALFFLYPSKRESFGIPILEAMAASCPVITSNVASMPEVAASAALLVNPLEVSDISEAIKSLYSDESLRNNLMEQGKERAAFFSWTQTAEGMLKEYKKLMR